MKLGDKIRYLREVEGSLRGLGRAMSQQEMTRAIQAETGSKLSQSYLSQIENGAAHPGEVLQGAPRIFGGRSRRVFAGVAK